MARAAWSMALRWVAAAAPARAGDPSDAELLARFIRVRDGAAFAELVRRHGPLVLGVCRRILKHEQDAEDAFQATFLVLARRAASVRPASLVGPWLHGVARRAALEARRAAQRRRHHETAAGARAAVAHPGDPALTGLAELLDAELARLPERYRAPLVLCELEGRSRREAAALLGCAEGTVGSRLSRARALLAGRLARHGLVVPVVGALAVLAAVSGRLSASAVGAALLGLGPAEAGALAPPAAGLAEVVLRGMLMAKVKATAATVSAAVLVAGLGVVFVPGPGGPGVGPVAAAAAPRDDDTPRAVSQGRSGNDELQRLREELRRTQAELAQARKLLAEANDRLARLERRDPGNKADTSPDLFRRNTPAEKRQTLVAPAPTGSPPRAETGPVPLTPPAAAPTTPPPAPVAEAPLGYRTMSGPGASDVQRRLERLERGMDTLLKEVEALRRDLRGPRDSNRVPPADPFGRP